MAELSIKEERVEKVRRICGESFTIGRSLENDMVLDDPAVSNRHCMIQLAGGDIRLVDLNSANGTIVDGNRIAGSVSLNSGSKIEVGRARITFFSETVPGQRLIITGPDMEETTLILGEETLAVGRVASNDLVLSHSGVSNFHMQITSVDKGYRVQDLGSTNGTMVNGDFVTALTLSEGDRIEMGAYTLNFRGTGEIPPPESAEASVPAVSPELPSVHVSVPGPQLAGGGAITAAAVIAGILVLLVLVEVIVQRVSGPVGPRAESALNLLIGNVSFEEASEQKGSTPGWQVEADADSIARLNHTVAYNGTSCLEIETKQGAALDSVVSCSYAEDIPVDRTRGYKGSFWVKTGQMNGFCLAGLEWIDMPSRQIVGEDFGRITMARKGWTRVMVGGIPPEEADRARLRFVTCGGQGVLYVDDAALYEVAQGDVGTVRYEAAMGDWRITMDPRGLFSLRSEEALLISRSEFVVDMGGVEARQSFSILASGYPIMDESGFTVRGKLRNLASGRLMKFESVVSARDASANLDYRVWPDKEDGNPTLLHLDLFIPSSVLRESGLRTITGEDTVVRRSTFAESNIDRIEMEVSGKVISIAVSSFDRVILKDIDRKGLKLILLKRVRDVPVGGSADVSLVITPN